MARSNIAVASHGDVLCENKLTEHTTGDFACMSIDGASEKAWFIAPQRAPYLFASATALPDAA